MPSPHYLAVEGQTIILVDWKLAFPSVNLWCCDCKYASREKADRPLKRGRSNFLEHKAIFPIWTHGGQPTWWVAMNTSASIAICHICKWRPAFVTSSTSSHCKCVPSPAPICHPLLVLSSPLGPVGWCRAANEKVCQWRIHQQQVVPQNGNCLFMQSAHLPCALSKTPICLLQGLLWWDTATNRSRHPKLLWNSWA